MDQKILETLSSDQKAKLAVAYLVHHRQEVPEELQRFFDKLQQYEDSTKDVMVAMREAENSLQELSSNFEQLKGSINAVVDLVANELNEDIVSRACAKYEMPPMSPQMAGAVAPMQAGATSMAGETAKMQVPPIVVPSGKPVAAPASGQ